MQLLSFLSTDATSLIVINYDLCITYAILDTISINAIKRRRRNTHLKWLSVMHRMQMVEISLSSTVDLESVDFLLAFTSRICYS